MTKFVAVTACLAANVALHFVNFIYGWGLSPKSWAILVLTFIGQIFFSIVLASVAKDE
jgi:RsiW-degrading membrane proteinase PrsW (M82 family)